MRSRALNALAQHAMNTGALLQIYQGTYEYAHLTVNLHVSCTVTYSTTQLMDTTKHTSNHTIITLKAIHSLSSVF